MKAEYVYNAKILEVVDGDTFVVSLDLGLEISKICRIRVFDLDTPEKFCKHGDAQEKELGTICKEYAAKILTNKKNLIQNVLLFSKVYNSSRIYFFPFVWDNWNCRLNCCLCWIQNN